MAAFSTLLEGVHEFLEMILGTEEAMIRIKAPAEEYKSGGWKSLLNGDLPEILCEEKKIDIKSEAEEAIEIFGELFTILSKKLKLDLKKVASNEWFELEEKDGRASIIQKEEEGFFGAIMEEFDFWVEDFSDHAKARPFVNEGLSQFDYYSIYPYVRENILKGALATRVKWGIDVMDGKPENNLPPGSSLFFSSPHCAEKELLVYQMLKEALIQGKGVLVTLTNISPDEFYKIMASLGIDAVQHSENLVIVDWYTYSERRVVNIEEKGNILIAARDMTNLGIAMDIGMQRLKEIRNKLAIMDFLSPLTKLDGFDGSYNFVQFLRSKFKENGFTSIFLMDSDMHPIEERSTMEQLFDSSVSMLEHDDRRELRVNFIGSEKVDIGYDFTWEEGDLIIKETEGLEMTTVLIKRDAEPFNLSIDNLNVIGRIMEGDIVLLEAPYGPESEALSYQFMRQGMSGGGAIITLSNISPDSLLQSLGVKKADSKKTIFVDWNSFKNEWIQGVDEKANIFKIAEDLTYLGVGMEKAIKAVAGKAKPVAAIDVLSPALKSFDFNQTLAFARAMRSKLKRQGITTLMYIDSDMHESDALAGMRMLADTIIVMSNRAKKSVGATLISMRMSRFGMISEGYYAADWEGSHLKIGSQKMSETGREVQDVEEQVLIQDDALIGWRGKLHKKEKEMKRREGRILFREEKVKAREEEFKVQIKAFQKDIERKIGESQEMERIKKELNKEEHKLREERAEIKKLWEALAQKEKMLNGK
jgi:KaiC/GvpD/RAD55 family RecA-like ATPase